MNELLSLAFALVTGFFLGIIFFAGLWWTVRKGILSKHPALWFLGSMLLRMGSVLFGFYFILGNSWQSLLTALFGLIVARLIVVRLTRITNQSGQLMQEASHAP